MSNAKLREKHVDGSYLQTVTPARISKLSSRNVVFPIRYDQGEGGETVHNGLSSLRPREALKELL